MPNPEFFTQLAAKLRALIPGEITGMPAELSAQFQQVLQTAFKQLQLVTEAEFAIQKKVLLRTREQLAILEQRIAQLEQQHQLSKQLVTPPADQSLDSKNDVGN